jgi:GNAT superfamily N-acetyltransferase
MPGMIDLLKASLGEGKIPKSEAYFRWKHELNPFGESYILLAEEDNRIVGLRAFMRWRWVRSGEIKEAVRAVDTATDPAFQGKGIFRKLTMEAVNSCINDGISLVFNSPNQNSMPGYLKMGWHVAGKMPLHMGLGSLLPSRASQTKVEALLDHYDCSVSLNKVPDDWEMPVSESFFHTPISKKYLTWRYADCPIVRYGSSVEPGKFGIIFRMKPIKGFWECRICECWIEKPQYYSALKKALRHIIKTFRPLLVTAAPSPFLFEHSKPFSLPGPFKKGPITTLRPLAMDNLYNFDGFKNWQPSMGSMELF